MRIVIVAGEASGDILGAGLMQALSSSKSDIHFSGIGGPKMQALGFDSLFPIERLSVMGLIEPLKRLSELLSIRKQIKQHCLDEKADLFIGIDSPDFNLNIERFTKEHGIKTVHYVSPSVWAWRQGRIKGIKKSVDLMLTLLPFEAEFYQQHEVPVKFVGHPLADDIQLETDTLAARKKLGVSETAKVLALMPGSRGSEVKLLANDFFQVAEAISKEQEDSVFLLPCANSDRRLQIEALLKQNNLSADIRLFDGLSHDVMAASDAVLLASGTTALEAMLLKKPMVVAYKMSPLSFFIISKMVKSQYVSLPNLLAGTKLVPEILQREVSVEALTKAVKPLLFEPDKAQQQISTFTELHKLIRKNASEEAASAVMELLL